jgi:hypothetical protein
LADDKIPRSVDDVRHAGLSVSPDPQSTRQHAWRNTAAQISPHAMLETPPA